MIGSLLIPRKAENRKSQEKDSFVFDRIPRLFVEDNMDIRTLFYNLREEVSCPVCSGIFTDPKQLSCLHSFCLKCLNHRYETSGGGNEVKCPKCQTLCRVPASGDLKDLPTSFYLNGLIDVLAIKECNTTQVTCGNCDKKSSEASYCFQCCIFYCEQCLIGHNMIRTFKDHRVLAVREFQDKDYEDVLKRPAFCPEPRHEKEEVRFFCKNCKLAVCQACINLKHSGHALEHIEDEAERRKTEMKNIVETQRQNLLAKKNTVKQLDEHYAKLIQQGEDLKRNVQKFADDLFTVIEARKQNIFAEVESQTKKLFESLTTQKNKIENEIKLIESSLGKADKLLMRSNNLELVGINTSPETIFEGIHVEGEPVVHDPGSLTVLVFVQNQKLLDTVKNAEIGNLQRKASQSIAEGKGLNETFAGRETQFTLTTKTAEGRQCYNKRDCVTVEVRDERGRECGTKVRISDNKNGQYKISYSPREQGRYSIIIKVNGEHVRDSPYDLLVKAPPFLFKPVLSFGKKGSSEGMFNSPWGVAVSDTDEIAVTDCWNHRVQIFDSGGNHLRSFGRCGSNQGEFSSPSGICFDNNRNIFVADSRNHRIQIFSGEGKYMGMFGGKGSLDSQVSNPWGLSLDANGNIIVADTGNKLIKIFSNDGKFVRKIGGPDSFSFPVHCVQCDEYLMVSDKDEHCIKVFSTEGKYQYTFERQGGGDGEFEWPYCMAVTKSKLLMVCEFGSDKMQVFELNGKLKFVGKFKTKGSNLEEFKMQTSVAVLTNGRIVVSDSFNNCIQLFE